MILDGIGIRKNETGNAFVYLPDIHTIIETNIKQEERVKDGYKISVKVTEDQVEYIKTALNDTFNLLEERSLSQVPHLGFCVITNDCNMDCSFCFAEKNSILGDSFDLNWIDKMLVELPKTSIGRVNLSGGEPLLYFDKVKAIQQKLKKIKIYTNGSLINEEVAEWAIENDVQFHIALDYSIEGFEGHDSSNVRDNLQKLTESYPELSKLLEIAITYPSDKITDFDTHRKDQKKSFEVDLEHEINYIAGDTSYLDYLTFDKELDNIESGKIKLDDSILNRQVRYVNRTISNYINVESCSPNVTLNFNGDVTSCFVNGSNVTHSLYNNCVISHVDNFTVDKYFEYANEKKKRGLCKHDCPAKYFCGNICWANIDSNKYNCNITRKSLFHVLYLELNYSACDLTNEINWTRTRYI